MIDNVHARFRRFQKVTRLVAEIDRRAREKGNDPNDGRVANKIALFLASMPIGKWELESQGLGEKRPASLETRDQVVAEYRRRVAADESINLGEGPKLKAVG